MNSVSIPGQNSMLSDIMRHYLSQLGLSTRIREAMAEYDAAVSELDLKDLSGGSVPDGSRIDRSVAALVTAYGESMFMYGWNLRGNPDLLATLHKDETYQNELLDSLK